MKNSARNFSTMNLVTTENAGEKHDKLSNYHLVLSAKRMGTHMGTMLKSMGHD